MKKTLLNLSVATMLLLGVHEASSQGCVAVRHMSCAAPGASSTDLFSQKRGTWQVNMGYRYFNSFRHFVGDVEQTQRLEQQTQVINDSHGLDIGISYLVNPRLSFTVNLPLQYNDRSSLYEHYGNPAAGSGIAPSANRFHTQSQGIGDVRFSASYWMIDPAKSPKFNFALGAGIKLPTGNYKVTDDFHKLDKEKKDYLLNKPVDQSIQLGDGGVGYNIDIQGYAKLGKKTAAYFNGFYLFNPKETNSQLRSPEATTIDLVTGYFSVADQFAARAGVSQTFLKYFALTLGGRIEGVPALDVFGGSAGFRRPGYIVSIEPGIAYMKGKTSISVNVPYALYRNRTRSYSDRLDPLGVKHGDAAFADYLVSVNLSRWF